MNNKGQTGGLITAIVFGVASLVIGVIIAFVIVSTLTDANLLVSGRTSATTTNESDTSGNIAFANTTGYTLVNFNSLTTAAISVSALWGDGNQSNGSQLAIGRTPSGYTALIPAANYSVIQTTGVLKNATTFVYPNVSVTYVITTKSNEEQATDKIETNLTKGVDNVSSKIPTVLLVAVIVLILAVLAILVGVWQRMRMGSGGSSL